MPVVSAGEITITEVSDGLDGPALQIISSAAGFTYQDGVASPADQTISFTLLRQGLDNTEANWAASGATLGTNKGQIDITEYIFGLPGTGDGDTAYLTLAQFGAARQMSIGATVGSLAAYANVSRIGDSTAQAGATRNVLMGEWTSSTAYGVGDIVVKDGFRWVCILAHVAGGSFLTPLYPATSNTYWTLYGTRGTLTASRAIAGTAWSDAEASTAIANAGGVSPVQGDVVTLFNTTAGYSETRIRSSGGPWTALSVIFGGNVIVDNTLTAGKIQAGAVTASKIGVSDLTNMVRNPSFQAGASDGWVLTASSEIQAKATAGVPTGAPSEFVLKSPLVTNTNNDCLAFETFDIRPGEVYHTEFYAASTAVANGILRMLLTVTDSTGVGLAYLVGATAPSSSQTWTRYYAQIAIPDTFVYNTVTYIPARAKITFGSVCSVTAVGSWYITKLQLRRAASAELIVDGAITAVKIASESVTTDKLAVGDFTVQARNASFEEGDTQWTKETGWAVQQDAAHARSGTWFATSTATVGSAIRNRQKVSVTQGETFYAEAYIKHDASAAGSGTRVRCVGYSAAGAEVQFAYGNYITAATTQYTRSTTSFTVGANTVSIDVEVESNITAGRAYADDVRLFRSSNTTLIADGAITTDKIFAGAITTDKLLVTGRGKALNDDPTFQDSSAWTKSGGGGSFALVTESTSPSGTKVLRATNDVQFSARQFPIVAGTRYKVTMWARRTAGTGLMYLRLYCRNAAGALVNFVATPLSGTGDLESIAVPSSWTKYTGYVNAGTATVNATLIVHVNWQTTGTTDVTDCRVEEYIGADLIVDGAITANKIEGGAVGAGKISAGAVTTDKLFVTGVGAALNDDPSTSDISAWTLYSGIQPTVETITGAATGTTALRGTNSTWVNSRTFAVDLYKKYRVRCWARRDTSGTPATGSFWLRAEWFDGAGASLSYTNATALTALTSSWVRRDTGEMTPPANAVSARVMLIFNYGGTTGYHEAQDVRFEEVVGADLIVDGSISALKLSVNSVTAGKIEAGSITADKIAANTITASKLIVADFSNMVQDPMMADNASWVSTGGAAWTTWGTSASEDPTFRSTRFMKITGASGSYAGFHYSKWMPVEPGQSYYITAQGRSVNGIAAGAQMNLEWAEDENRTGYVENSFTSTGSDTPVDVAQAVTAPAGKRFLRVRFYKNNNTATEVRWGGLIVRRRMNGELIVDGAITTLKIGAGEVKAGNIEAGAVTAAKIQAGAVTASKIAVGDFTVQARNWNFEEGDAGWTKETGWTIVSDATNARSGSWVARGQHTAPSALRNTQRVSVEPGETFYAEAYIKHVTATGTGSYVRITAFNAAGSDLAQGNGNTVTAATTAYTKSFVSYTVPASAASVAVEVVSNITAGSAYVDEARLFRTSNTTLIANGAITTDKIGTGEVKAGNIFAGAVTTDKLDALAVTAAKIATDAVTATKIEAGAVTAAKVSAGAITTSKLLVVPASICPDPYFSDEAWWTATQFDTNGWYFESDTTMSVGKQASLWSGHPTNNPGASRRHIWSAGVAVPSIGTWVRLRARMRNNSNQSFYVAARFYNRLNATLADITLTSTEGSGTQDLTAQGQVPANAVSVRFIIYNEANNTFSGDITASAVILDQAATADLIVDGAISAAKISAGAITTDKLLVTGRGKALNDDPFFQDASAWTKTAGTGSFALVTESTSPSGTRVLRATNNVQFSARQFPVVAGTRYKVTMWSRRTAGSGLMYLRLYCYNAAGTLVNYEVTKLDASGTLENIAVPSAWTKYTGYINAGAATVNGTLIVHVNWETTGTTDVADCRVEEYIGADLIVDGSISATKLSANAIAVGTAAIQNGAIVNAMIGNAAIDSAKIADAAITTAKIGDAQITNAKINDLNASKITAGTISADRIGAGSITATKIDSRGLDIKDANGNTILSAGASVAASTFLGNVTGTVDGDAASTVKTGAANGTTALNAVNNATTGLATKLSSNARTALTGSGGVAVGSLEWNTSGVRTSGQGIGLTSNGLAAYNAAGDATFSILASNGNATFAGALSAATGSFTGAVYGGSYTASYAWPAAGTPSVPNFGFHLSSGGLLLGNYNTLFGTAPNQYRRYFQIEANGDVYAPGFSIVNGAATFSGTLTANTVNTTNIVGAAVSSGYATSGSSSATSISVSVVVPVGTSAVVILGYAGTPYIAVGGSGKDSYNYTAIPSGTVKVQRTHDQNGVAVSESVQTVTTQSQHVITSINGPTPGTWTVTLERDAASGTFNMAVVVNKR